MVNRISEAAVNAYLEAKGFKHANLGFRYLKYAITSCNLWSGLFQMSVLYRDIAEHFNTSPMGVERAIWHTLKLSNLGISNKEFIAKAIDDLSCHTPEIVFSDEHAQRVMSEDFALSERSRVVNVENVVKGGVGYGIS